MKVGDLVTPGHYCGGPPGGIRCSSALVLDIRVSHHEAVQVDSQVYHDREVYEYTLSCSCGVFEEYEDHLELIDGSW